MLIVGGRRAAPLATAELYDPDTETTRAIAVPASLTQGALGLAGAALAAMPDGRVALVGGPQPGLAVFDPASGAFEAPVLTGVPRAHHAAVAVDEAHVLVVGGCAALDASGDCNPVRLEAPSVIIDVRTGDTRPAPAPLQARIDPTVVVEHGRDGRRRFIVGGGTGAGGAPGTTGQRLGPDRGAAGLTAPSADAQRNENLTACALDDLKQAVAFVKARDGVLVKQLVGPLFIVVPSKNLGLSQHAQAFEMNAFNEVRALDVEPRNNANHCFTPPGEIRCATFLDASIVDGRERL